MSLNELLQLLCGLFLATSSAMSNGATIYESNSLVGSLPDARSTEDSVPTPPIRISETPVDVVGGSQGSGGWRKDPEVSWYGPGFYGNRTACGKAYTKTILGVAHRSLPCGTLVVFRWKGKEITVPVIDRGPYVAGRTWDLSGGLCTYLDHCFTGPIEWRFK